MKIAGIVGARPNLVKIAPLIREIRKRPGIEWLLVHTGQHYDDKLSRIFFQQMEIPQPNINLGVGSGSQAWQTGEVLKRVESVFLENKPDLVLVVGDVNSTAAASLAAAKLGIPIAHVEAGLRSFDRTMPEEINRIVTDTLADYHFVTEQAGVDNLLREGRPQKRIYLVGNVMIDALRLFLPLAQKSCITQELGLANGNANGLHPFALLTLHRPSNVDRAEILQDLLRAVYVIAQQIPVIFPAHPRTSQRLGELSPGRHPNLCLIPPLGYLDFLCLMSSAKLVLTDSGGVQEETTALRVPCLTLRENTERPITVTEGTNELIGKDPERIISAAKKILSGNTKPGRVPQLWDGHAAERIVDILLREVFTGQPRDCDLPSPVTKPPS
jgi:UDP-N-acetylglucosamine 2-epimerase (non-hydrolysing)